MDVSKGIFAITLLAGDVALTKDFYSKVFETRTVFEDENSVVFQLGPNLINILGEGAVGDLFAPADVAPIGSSAGAHRSLLTLQVADVDAEFAQLQRLGVAVNSGPVNQPWGIRTITFADPTGQMWELSMPTPEAAE